MLGCHTTWYACAYGYGRVWLFTHAAQVKPVTATVKISIMFVVCQTLVHLCREAVREAGLIQLLDETNMQKMMTLRTNAQVGQRVLSFAVCKSVL